MGDRKPLARDARPTAPSVRARSLAALALLLLTGFVYEDVRTHAFVDFDDSEYVAFNPQLDGRLEWQDVALAFEPYNSNWAPLTSISFVLGDAIHGRSPGAYAATNACLHALAAVLLMLALCSATGRLGPSAFVAAVFAIHPLHVESVAWISERKEVLAGVFWMAALAAYPRAARSGRVGPHALVFLLGLLALLSKATAVALPLTLLLFDLWPLGRLQDGHARRGVLVEKLPLALAAAAVAVVTLIVQTEGGSNSTAQTALDLRLLNAGRAYAQYVVESFWPGGLAYYYPYPSDAVLRSPTTFAATSTVVALTVAALFAIRRQPLFAMGWLWFVVVLVPMIGIVRVGGQGHADRYVYVAQTGLALIVAFGLAGAVERAGADSARRRAASRLSASLLALGLAAIVALALVARRQVSVWRDSRALFSHAVAVSPDNAHAHRFLGVTLWTEGDRAGGMTHLVHALDLSPDWGEARLVYATALLQSGRLDDAAREIETAAADAADPGLVAAARGVVADRRGDAAAAVAAYEAALEQLPGDWEVLNNLAWLRATSPDPALRVPEQAIALAERAKALRPGHAYVLGTLAAAYASAGRLDEALAAQTDAIEVLRTAGDEAALARFERQLEDYRSRRLP